MDEEGLPWQPVIESAQALPLHAFLAFAVIGEWRFFPAVSAEGGDMNMRAAAPLALAFVLWAITAPGPSTGAIPSGDARFERLSAAVARKMEEHGVPGAALGVLHQGRIVTRGFGVTSVDNPLPVTAETLFQAGSITKTFTATLILRLAEAGRLRLDAPVRDYIPAFRVQDETASREATVLTLLTHTGGWEGDFFEDPGDGDEALAEVVKRMAGLEQVSPVHSAWSYNNSGFYVAGRLIELVTGRTYEQALEERIFRPLELRRTFLVPADVMIHRFAVGHGGPPGRVAVRGPWALPRVLRPAGGVVTTIGDLLRFGQFHVGDGSTPGGGARLLSRTSMERMRQTHLSKNDHEEMAIAWNVSSDAGVRQLWHEGSTVGQQALLLLVPSRQLAVALLTNSFAGEQLNREISRLALAEYLGLRIADPQPLPFRQAELAEYVGRYSRPFLDVVVTIEGDHLLIQTIQKRGFPTPASPVPPPGRPSPFALYARDRLIATGGPQKGARADILRRPDGTVGWIRVGGRVSARR